MVQPLVNIANLNSSRSSRRVHQKTMPPLTNLLRIFFNFSYCICVIPFRIKVDHRAPERFSVHKWKPQQVICACLHFLSLICSLTGVRLSTPTDGSTSEKNPVRYFEMIMSTSSLVSKLFAMKQFWFHSLNYVHVLNFLDSKHNYSSKLPKIISLITNSIVIKIVLSLYTLMAVLSLVTGKFFIVGGLVRWSPTWWWRRLVLYTRYSFFYDNGAGSESLRRVEGAPSLSEITGVDTFFSLIMTFGLFTRFLLGFFVDLTILSLSLSLWSAAKLFSDEVTENLELTIKVNNENSKEEERQEGQGNNWNTIFHNFDTIRKLTMLINKAAGSMITCYVTEAVMYYSVSLHSLLTPTDIFTAVTQSFYYGCTICILFFSADICRQLEVIKLWIAEKKSSQQWRHSNIPEDEMILVLHEMLAKDVGIQGSHIFTITYSFVGTFLSLVATYFVICVQFNEVT